ncbi:MAG: hypothetical protein JNJ78_20155 [Anaerolineae bacterium]|nr:hypothetical protein [Anaerolineae bacterium]
MSDSLPAGKMATWFALFGYGNRLLCNKSNREWLARGSSRAIVAGM